MPDFTKEDLTNRPDEVAAAAAEWPVEIECEDGRSLVLMSREEYARLRSATRKVYSLDEIPDEMLLAMIDAIESMPEDEEKAA